MRLAASIVALVAIGAGGAWWFARPSPAPLAPANPSPVAATDDSLARVPSGTRVTVRVVNASGRRGVARRAALWLRGYGYDVVDFDGLAGAPREQTTIADHAGHPAWAERLRRAVGTGRVSPQPDSSRYVDLTLVIGRDWQPPSQPLRP